MIQELLSGGNSVPNGFLGERKISIPFSSPSSTTCPSSTPILTTTTTTSITTTPTSNNLANLSNSPSSGNNNNNNNNNNHPSEANTSQQNLRCPRCDSTNTKFCYYNNYNLTQPRHFCKTCRRYWTKGGTLRNVPIGGGCRKNKTTTTSGSAAGFVKSSSNSMAKAKATLSSELLVNGGNPGFLGTGLLDHLHHSDLQSGCPNPNPILWHSLPQNSHILSLLRGSTQFHNPNPNPNPISSVFNGIKTEVGGGNTTTATTLGLDNLDSYGNGAPSNLLGSFSRNNQRQINESSSGVLDYFQNNGNNSNILELYQRLKSSSSSYNNYCGNENNPGSVILGNMVGSPSSSSPMHSTILNSAPVSGGDHFGGYGFMSSSPAIISGWSDFPTVPINGTFP